MTTYPVSRAKILELSHLDASLLSLTLQNQSISMMSLASKNIQKRATSHHPPLQSSWTTVAVSSSLDNCRAFMRHSWAHAVSSSYSSQIWPFKCVRSCYFLAQNTVDAYCYTEDKIQTSARRPGLCTALISAPVSSPSFLYSGHFSLLVPHHAKDIPAFFLQIATSQVSAPMSLLRETVYVPAVFDLSLYVGRHHVMCSTFVFPIGMLVPWEQALCSHGPSH